MHSYATLTLLINLAFPLRSLVQALPQVRQSITPLSQDRINSFARFTHYAGAGGCTPDKTLAWNCGTHCTALSGFKPTASGGDGNDVQFWFVGFDPVFNATIVSHQGTDFSKIEPIVTDFSFHKSRLSSSLFPGVPGNVEVHSGFKESQEDTAALVLDAVKKTISEHGSQKIFVVGASLGGAITLLDGVYLSLQIPTATVSIVTYSMPRVGNEAFANYIDAKFSKGRFTRITNHKDLVPILPGRFMGYSHPSNEIHIKGDGSWVNCPGQDNTSKDCSVGDVRNVLFSDPGDHLGPFNGVRTTC